MATIEDLKKMKSEPSGKEWFAKHGLPKGISNHPLKQKVAEKMGGKSDRNKAKKYFYDEGVKNVGKEKTIKGLKHAFGKHSPNK